MRTFFLIIIAASMFPNHVRGYFGEMFTTVPVMKIFIGTASDSVAGVRQAQGELRF